MMPSTLSSASHHHALSSCRPLQSASSTKASTSSRSTSSSSSRRDFVRFSRRAASATSTVKVSADAKKETTVEYQRTKAKEMVKYFKEMQYQQLVEDSTVFGWTKKNEINNGRWTMFGLLVGMMTEYATGVDFIDQIKHSACWSDRMWQDVARADTCADVGCALHDGRCHHADRSWLRW